MTPPPPDSTLYHEAGHLVVAKREGYVPGGINFFPENHGFTAMAETQPVKNGRAFEPTLAQAIRVHVAGLHAQEICTPSSFSLNTRNAIAESGFIWSGHSFNGRLTNEELAELSDAKADLEAARNKARSERYGDNLVLMHRYLKRRELEVRKFLHTDSARHSMDRLVAAIKNWFLKGQLDRPIYPGACCRFPGGSVKSALAEPN